MSSLFEWKIRQTLYFSCQLDSQALALSE